MTWITSRYHPRQASCARVQIHQIGLLLYQINLFSFSVVTSLPSSIILVELFSASAIDMIFSIRIIIYLFRTFQSRNSISFRTDFLHFFFYSYTHILPFTFISLFMLTWYSLLAYYSVEYALVLFIAIFLPSFLAIPSLAYPFQVISWFLHFRTFFWIACKHSFYIFFHPLLTRICFPLSCFHFLLSVSTSDCLLSPVSADMYFGLSIHVIHL